MAGFSRIPTVPQTVMLHRSGHANDPSDEQRVTLHPGAVEIGSISYHTCRTAYLHEIGIMNQYQRRGVGFRAITALRADFPGYH